MAIMYVCLCNAYTESDIRDAAAEGARTTEEAYWSMGDGPCCRRCVPTAQQIIDKVHDGSVPPGTAMTGPDQATKAA